MEQFKERRRHIRRIGHGLVVIIDRHIHPIANISTSGVRFQATGLAVGDVVTAHLARMTSLSDTVPATITVKAADGAIIQGEFHPTIPLLRFIIGHIGEVTAVKPSYFVP